MAENTIGRRIWETHCIVDYVDSDNEIHENCEVTVAGRLSLTRAHSKVCRKLGTKNAIIKDDLKYTSKFYSMSTQKFIENADTICD